MHDFQDCERVPRQRGIRDARSNLVKSGLGRAKPGRVSKNTQSVLRQCTDLLTQGAQALWVPLRRLIVARTVDKLARGANRLCTIKRKKCGISSSPPPKYQTCGEAIAAQSGGAMNTGRALTGGPQSRDTGRGVGIRHQTGEQRMLCRHDLDRLVEIVGARITDFPEYRLALTSLEFLPDRLAQCGTLDADGRMPFFNLLQYGPQHFWPTGALQYIWSVILFHEAFAAPIYKGTASAEERGQPRNSKNTTPDFVHQRKFDELEIGKLGSGLVAKDKTVSCIAIVAAHCGK